MAIRLDTADAGFRSALRGAARRPSARPPTTSTTTVRAIVADVRKRGDAALLAYTQRFDRHDTDAGRLRVSADEIAAADGSVRRPKIATR